MIETVTQVGSIINGVQLIGDGREEIEVVNPYNNEIIGSIFSATIEDVNNAVECASSAYKTMKNIPAYKRSEILRKAADLLQASTEKFARQITLEAGKPIIESRVEVNRAVQVLRFASEGAKSIFGEQIPLDNAIGGEGQIGITKRVPLGVVAAITPFNFPLNLVLHKVAPAIASGNTIVLKPAEKTPLTSVLLYQLLVEAGLPKGALNILMGYGEKVVEPLVTHPKVKKVTFTGSVAVGWKINDLAKRKKITLELGSNAPNVVFADADLDNAVNSLVIGGFTYAGQTCVSAQRIYVHEEIYEHFLQRLVEKVRGLKIGNPLDETTTLGPMITEEAAKRAESWIREAEKQGAKVLIGGKRRGTILEPTVIKDATTEMKVVCLEVFAPVISILPFKEEEEVLEYVNDSDLALHAGIFTKDINRAFRIAEAIESGGVWINEVSTKRFDHIPYGGIKNSGVGKEGVKYAIEEMTDIKFFGIKIN